ncbi:hypothetical protein [Fulvimarina sp. MAC8]|uniref:hypothetical protein n=1 Tax=Fulvimarina sp. MAC8 TaxID=3162874 RepID=UPI0032EEA02B
MAYYDHTSNTVRQNAPSGNALITVAAALGIILAVGIVGQVAGDWTGSAVARMSQTSAITDWRGNSASLPAAE